MTPNYAPISVVIPCWRCKDTIERALDSVLKQSLLPAQIILVDDLSDDGTLEFIKSLAEVGPKGTIQVCALNVNGGPGLARNAGWDLATQPWIAFLDADDAWHPEKIKTQFLWLQKNPKVVLCGHLSEFMPKKYITKVDRLYPKKVSLLTMLFSNLLPTRSIMLKSDLPYRFVSGRSEDYRLWLQIICKGHEVYILKNYLAFFFKPEYSSSGFSGDLWRHEKAELDVIGWVFKNGHINNFAYAFFYSWSYFKYIRRVFLTLFK